MKHKRTFPCTSAKFQSTVILVNLPIVKWFPKKIHPFIIHIAAIDIPEYTWLLLYAYTRLQ